MAGRRDEAKGRQMTADDPKQIVEALAIHEDTLSAVYTAYARAYPDVQALWRTMAAEEHVHGNLLRSILERDIDLESYVAARQFVLADIVEETKKLRDFAALAGVAGLTMPEAFRSAVHFEDALIESEALTVTPEDTPEVAAVLGTLREQTERHQRRLSESLATYER
jgi:hypothetical protein